MLHCLRLKLARTQPCILSLHTIPDSCCAERNGVIQPALTSKSVSQCSHCHTDREQLSNADSPFLVVQAVKYQPKNLQAWNLLGLCQTSMGDIWDGIRAYQRVIDLQPNHREAWVNTAQARKEVSPVCVYELCFFWSVGVCILSVHTLLTTAVGVHV